MDPRMRVYNFQRTNTGLGTVLDLRQDVYNAMRALLVIQLLIVSLFSLYFRRRRLSRNNAWI